MAIKIKTGAIIGLAALALAVGTAMLWFYLTRQVALPDNRIGFAIAFLSAAALGVYAYVKGTGILGALPPALAIVIGIFLPFTMYISPQVVEEGSVIKVGDTIPAFTAPDEFGELFDSASLDDHLILIKFFRAHW